MVLNRYNPLLHRTAVVTCLATLMLIFMGGLVTSHGAGMSVPDWPNSYGYNMWLFPPSLWWNQGGIFYEHSHRLMGTLVGLCCIIQAAIAWKVEPRRWVRNLAYATLAFCVVQGVLGGFRVILVQLHLAILHGISAQLFFCTAALFAMATSNWWNKAPNLAWSEDHQAGRRLIRLAWVAVSAVFAQLVIGAVMRHHGAGLAMHADLLPATSAAALEAVNSHRAFDLHLDRVSMTQVWLHFGHRVGAVIVTAVILWLVAQVFHRHGGKKVLAAPALILAGLLLAQVTLGVLTIYYRKPADIASAHVAVGACVLVYSFMVAVRSMRLYSRRFRVRDEPVRVEVTSVGARGFLVS